MACDTLLEARYITIEPRQFFAFVELGVALSEDVADYTFIKLNHLSGVACKRIIAKLLCALFTNRLTLVAQPDLRSETCLRLILSVNKCGCRSDPVRKRFGRLKADLEFGEAHVFHSIRKTVTTLLESAGVSENIAADIVGHDKPRITYGFYSGGANLETKRRALEKLAYPSL